MKETPIIPVFLEIKTGKLKDKLLFKTKIKNKKEEIKDLLLEGLIQENNNKDLKNYLNQKLKQKNSINIENSNESNKKTKKRLNDKIKLGRIDYLNYKELEIDSNRKDILLKKKKLFKSKNFEIGKKSFSFNNKSYSYSLEKKNNNSNKVLSVNSKSKKCIFDKNFKQLFLTENIFKNNNFKNNQKFNNSIYDYSYSFTPKNINRKNTLIKSSSLSTSQIKLMKNKKRLLISQNSKEISKLSINSSNNNSQNNIFYSNNKTSKIYTNIINNKRNNNNTIIENYNNKSNNNNIIENNNNSNNNDNINNSNNSSNSNNNNNNNNNINNNNSNNNNINDKNNYNNNNIYSNYNGNDSNFEKKNIIMNNNSNKVLLKNTFKILDIPLMNLIEKKRAMTPLFSDKGRELLSKKLRKIIEENINAELEKLKSEQKKEKDKLKKFLKEMKTKKEKKMKKMKIKKDLNLEINEILDYKMTKEEKEELMDKELIKTKKGIEGNITSKKAKMIIFSDRINNMDDNHPLLYSGNICDEYYKYSRNAGLDFITLKNGDKYYLHDQNNLEHLKRRKKLMKNYNKIHTMNFTIAQKKIQLVKRYDKDIKEGKNF
jgi:hypothetical protein